eukprot:3319457-Prymnesium_polylepis.1
MARPREFVSWPVREMVNCRRRKAGVIISFGACSSGQLGHYDVNDDDEARYQFEPRIIRRLQGAK